jgi:hypothetical protein
MKYIVKKNWELNYGQLQYFDTSSSSMLDLLTQNRYYGDPWGSRLECRSSASPSEPNRRLNGAVPQKPRSSFTADVVAVG